MDTTIKGLTLTHESIRIIFMEICNVSVKDDIAFEIVSISDIRETDDYPGIRVAFKAKYFPISVPLSVDITTGDKITPHEVKYEFQLLFEERTIPIMAYNLETILAEKIEMVLSRGIANTRPRDFYDIYILYSFRGAECSPDVLRKALEQTAKNRGSMIIIPDYKVIIENILNSNQMQRFWENYQHDFAYARDISFKMACDTIIKIMTWI